MSFVADSSVGIAWVVPSQSSRATERLLDDVVSGASFVVPALWAFEVANSLIVLTRRKRLTKEDCSRARLAVSKLAPVVDEEGHRMALLEISELAERYSLSAYDAAYLELALRRRLPLATRDQALNKAARASGAKTLL
jgi:predicted nucleic acid-binding protein